MKKPARVTPHEGDQMPLMNKWELEECTRYFMRVKPRRTYLEIGSQAGGSLSWFGRRMESGSVLISVSIPTPGHPHESEHLANSAERLRAIGQTVHLICKPSQKALAAVLAKLNDRPVDVLLIDGDHRRADADVELYIRFVRPGGMVILHDAGLTERNPQLGPVKAWFRLSWGRRAVLIQREHGTGIVWMEA